MRINMQNMQNNMQKYGEICPFVWCKALMSSQKAGISFGIFQNQAFIQEVWLNPG